MRCLPFAILLTATSAAAIPAPMPPAQMAREADMVFEGEVKSVECAGPPVDKGDFVVVEYRSELTVVRAISGKPPSSVTLSGYQVEWKEEQPTGGAPPTEPLPKGWRGKLYLDHAPGGGLVPVWYNALEEDRALSKREPLPQCGAKKSCSGCAIPERDGGYAWGLVVAFAALASWRKFAPRREVKASRRVRSSDSFS